MARFKLPPAFLLVLVFAMFFALMGPVQRIDAQPVRGPIYCNSSATYDAATNGKTKLITAAGGSLIYVCGYTFFSAGTVNVSLVYGTGSNCATEAGQITPAYQFTTQTGIVDRGPIFDGMQVPSGNDLCIKTSAGVATQARVSILQQ